ncbi:helicase C-terminal domain-containing protein [Umbelopsis sp. PMI_123]|nr:helicase C-terminal domain-containing protein [Umbelopsis sp. PMI_123]
MPEYNLRGITVHFPHEAYNVQKTFMESVIQALHERSNALLESPTGTGKTLTLLCAALAWRQVFDTRHQMENLKEQNIYQDEALKKKMEGSISSYPETENWQAGAPKIYYASRTHSQLTQVVKELKNTIYNPKVCILGSREQLCIHKEVKAASSNATRTAMCRRKVNTKGCSYYAGTKETKKIFQAENEIMDIEDIVSFGEKHKACPFYLSKDSQLDADVILLPYNYIVDSTARKAMNIDLCNSIIIFDEAHNLESCCGEATSFEISMSTLRNCVQEMRACQSAVVPNVDDSERMSQSFSTLADLLDRLRSTIEKVELSFNDELIKPGIFIYELLNTVEINSSTVWYLQQGIDSAVQVLTSLDSSSRSNFALNNLSNALRMIFRTEYLVDNDEKFSTAHTKFYRVHIQNIRTPGGSSERQLSYWCFSPGLAMKDLVNLRVRCVILASGTLAPLSSFASELLLKFPVRLENSHVINANQAFIAVLPKGPAGTILSSTYERRRKPAYKNELGNTIVNFSKVIPEGLLVFFPSYAVMADCISTWRSRNGQTKSIWDRLNEQKQVFVEPKTKHEFSQAINGYYNKIKDPAFDGAIFMAVCRGKVSEGVDFADGRGRAVVITGIPFAHSKDPKIVQKKNFLDDIRSTCPDMSQTISGNEWYQQQALRAVNQAIGRVIRHRNDYGAILLCDERFGNPSIISQLSAWIRDYVKVYQNFGEVQAKLTKFFKDMKHDSCSVASDATRSDRQTVTSMREAAFPRRPINLGGDDSEGSGLVTIRNYNPRTALAALNDYSILRDSQMSNTQREYSGSGANGSGIATLEQAQAYSQEIATLGPDKHRMYKKIVRQFKRKEIGIEPFIDGLIDIFIGENRLDLLRRFRIFLPRKHIQLFDRVLRAQELIPDNSDVAESNYDDVRVKKRRID